MPNTYSPLAQEKREVRLLHLTPRNSSSQKGAIKCTFSVVSLDASPRPVYEALSYVWGNLKKERQIHIDGVPVAITKNLYNALNQLQYDDEPRMIWADAVCINQDDDEERAHQVSQMQLLYERATLVVVYLGPAWEGSDDAFEFFEKTGSDSALHYSPSLLPHAVVGGRDTSSEILRDSIIQFFDLGWWKRVWTVQEFVLAQDIVFQCGARTLSLESLMNSFKNVNAHDDGCCAEETCFTKNSVKFGIAVWDGFIRMDMLSFMRTKRHSHSFLQTISSFRNRQCYDAKDRIYGMLGLAREAWTGRITPDYNKGIEDVYRSVVSAAVGIDGTLDFLAYCYGSRQLKSLPSIVPDWTAHVDELSLTCHLSRAFAMKYYDASRKTRADFEFVNEKKAVSAGSICDTIAALEPARSQGSTTPDDLRRWLQLAQKGDNPVTADIQKDGNVWPTMCGSMGCEWDGKEHNYFWRRYISDTDWPKYKKWHSWVMSGHDSELDDADVSNFDSAHCATSKDRQFALTERGRLGWVPREANVGDLVVVLNGADVPYILRTCQTIGSSSSTDCYSLVGDAYIHGLMDGEAIKEDGSSQGRIYLV